jgi:hypothetical protein
LFTSVNANGTGRPISARTDFIEDWDTLGYDGLTLATHELFHAIGFTVNYGDFAAKLGPTPGAGGNPPPVGSRSYSSAAGIQMVLTPANQATHADPAATGAAPWPVTGYNQANDIMQPTLGQGVVRTLSARDFLVLGDAFGWNTSGITFVTINLGNSHDDVDMAIITAAEAAIMAQWNNAGNVNNRPVFTWTVAEVAPEPATWAFILGGVVLLVAVRRRAVN